MAVPRFKTSALPLIPQDVVSNMEVVMDCMSDVREMMHALRTKFGDAKDMADQAGYPADITSYTKELERHREEARQIQDECQSMMSDVGKKVDKLKELALAPPETFPSLIGTFDAQVRLFLLRLLPQVIKDEESLLDVHPKVKELIEQDLDLKYRSGPSSTQLAAETERVSELETEVQVLAAKVNLLQVETRKQRSAASLQNKNHTAAFNKLNQEHVRALEASEGQVEALEDKVSKVQRLKDEHKKRGDQYKQAHNLQAKISTKYLTEKQELTKALNAANETILSQEEEIEKLKRQVQEYSLAKDDSSTALKTLNETCIALQNEKASLRRAAKQDMENLRSDHDTALAELQAEWEQAKDQVKEAHLRLDAAQEDIDKLQREKDKLRKELGTARDIRNEQRTNMKKLKDELQDQVKTVGDLREEKQALQDDLEGEQRKVVNLQRSVQRGQQRVDKLVADQDRYKKNEQALHGQLQDGAVESETVVRTLQNQLVSLQDRLDNTEDERVAAIGSLNEAFSKTEAAIEQYRKIRKAYQSAQEENKKIFKEKKEKISSLEEANQGLQGRVNDLTRQNDSLIQEKNNAEAKAKDAATHLSTEQKLVQQRTTAWEAARTALTNETAAKDRLQLQYDKLTTQLKVDAQQIANLSNSLQNSGQEQEALQHSLRKQAEQHEKTLAAWKETHKAATESDQLWRESFGKRLDQDYREKASQLKQQYNAEVEQARYAKLMAEKAEQRLQETNTQLEQTLLQAQITARTASNDLTTERTTHQLALQELQDADAWKLQATKVFLSRLCQVPTDNIDGLTDLVHEIQAPRGYVVARHLVEPPLWRVLDTWGREDDIVAQPKDTIPTNAEILLLQLLGGATVGCLATRQCHWRLQRLLSAIASSSELHIGLMDRLATAFVQGIVPKTAIGSSQTDSAGSKRKQDLKRLFANTNMVMSSM
ncbi:hypothetical protein N0V93_005874 [Gnomoniopsis smithogilvyi]|uniref:Uncharacterized protein n=1 Tax=Gnomoniopsis smithogilvyi TaxID=1191159 RepID=A0A9W8YXG1_9PEZI|nr:hypothetical protein N0V93_005874 [Gnomoniopsis smithogilvyi]